MESVCASLHGSRRPWCRSRRTAGMFWFRRRACVYPAPALPRKPPCVPATRQARSTPHALSWPARLSTASKTPTEPAGPSHPRCRRQSRSCGLERLPMLLPQLFLGIRAILEWPSFNRVPTISSPCADTTEGGVETGFTCALPLCRRWRGGLVRRALQDDVKGPHAAADKTI